MAVDDVSYKTPVFFFIFFFKCNTQKQIIVWAFLKRLAFIVKAGTLHFLADVGSLTYSLAVGH